VAEVIVPGFLSCGFGSSLYDGPDTTLTEIDERLSRSDVFVILVASEIGLEVGWKIRVSRLSSAASRVLPLRNSKPILSAVGLFDMLWFFLGDLECSKPDERTELNDHIISVACCRPSEVLDLRVSKPDFVSIFRVSGFQSHVT
jgi:hypothetical protein